MCEHCGCREIEPIAELMDEHYALLDEAHLIRQALAEGDRSAALGRIQHLVAHLHTHVTKEEEGIFTALRNLDEFVDEVEQLEKEHVMLDDGIGGLDPSSPGFEQAVTALLAELEEHVERENLGIFPVSVVTLGAEGWDRVDRARSDHPTFLDGEQTAR
ncbi:hemerythrin domain-containing protein [Nocardioides insulae]|uniref:hemerythrin domain-containing protein n=1 Tax=Nocardioides insulae TaxID=394734 RepID=UPI000422F152|nr:hemerythrin domain-containing protein [Nocardioides insulae]